MSEHLNRLPLFPLGSVLFPNMPLKLHIFEERYKLMINHCIERREPFGVVLIKDGVEALGPLAQPHPIGCTAHITQVQRLPFGRMNILAVGRERFRVQELYKDLPYLSAVVDLHPIVEDDIQGLSHYAQKLHPLLIRYLTTLEKAGRIEFDPSQIPTDHSSLAYLSAVLLQSEADEKQSLLESDDMKHLLASLVRHYRREVALLSVMTSPSSNIAGNSPFSLN